MVPPSIASGLNEKLREVILPSRPQDLDAETSIAATVGLIQAVNDLSFNKPCAELTDLIVVLDRFNRFLKDLSRRWHKDYDSPISQTHASQRKAIHTALEAAFLRWEADKSPEGDVFASAMLHGLRIVGGRDDHQISLEHYRRVQLNRALLREQYREGCKAIIDSKSTYHLIRPLERGSGIFCLTFRQDSESKDILLIHLPNPQDLDCFVRGALNTHELGFSGLLPGAVGVLRAGISKDGVAVGSMQGLYKAAGPFPLSNRQVRTVYQYQKWQEELMQALFELEDLQQRQPVNWSGSLLCRGGKNNLPCFQRIAEAKGYAVTAQPYLMVAQYRGAS